MSRRLVSVLGTNSEMIRGFGQKQIKSPFDAPSSRTSVWLHFCRTVCSGKVSKARSKPHRKIGREMHETCGESLRLGAWQLRLPDEHSFPFVLVFSRFRFEQRFQVTMRTTHRRTDLRFQHCQTTSAESSVESTTWRERLVSVQSSGQKLP